MAKARGHVGTCGLSSFSGIQGAVYRKRVLDEVRILQGIGQMVDPFCPATKRNKLIQELGDRVEAYTS